MYLNYFEQARYDYLEAAGIAPPEMARKGWQVHVVRIEVEYRRECLLGQVLRVRTQVERFRNSSMVIRQELRRQVDHADDVPAVTARVVAVWVGRDSRPVRIPGEVRAALQPVSGGDPVDAPDPDMEG